MHGWCGEGGKAVRVVNWQAPFRNQQRFQVHARLHSQPAVSSKQMKGSTTMQVSHVMSKRLETKSRAV